MPEDLSFLPPHEHTPVPGFHAYSHQVSVQSGQTLDVRVSYDGVVEAQVVRLATKPIPRTTETLGSPQPIADLGWIQAVARTVCRGSYVHVADFIALRPPFAVELWCRILIGGRNTGLVSQNTWQLAVANDDRVAFAIRGRSGWERLEGPAVQPKRWHHVVGQFDGSKAQVFLDGRSVAETIWSLDSWSGGDSLYIGAVPNADGRATGFMTGDVCSPSLYRRTLSHEEVARRHQEIAIEPGPQCIGHWKFDALNDPPYRDVSPSASHGKGVNYPLRMIPGPRITEEQPWSTYDPTKDQDFGHAVRFMSDQVVDCRWPQDLSWSVSADQTPGQYAVRLRNPEGQVRFVPFLIRPTNPTAKLMCLSTTNTRIAYNFKPFDDPALDYGAYREHPVYPMFGHLLGQRRPATGSHYYNTVVNLELPFYAWLDRQGIDYDLYSEWDLAADPALLNHYDVVAWAGHSEYWTASRFEILQRFRRREGHILSLSGNTCFWRVNIDLLNGVVEVRKHGDAATAKHGGTVDPMLDNAHWHQMDHLPGTTMHTCGWPQFQLGLGQTNGWTTPCEIDGPRAAYEVVAPEHHLFKRPHRIRTAFPFARGGAGYETDISLRSMLERFGPSRRSDIAPRDSLSDVSYTECTTNGPTVLARARLGDSEVFDYDLGHSIGELWSEIHFWEKPGQGITFAAGSCMASLALQDDENFSNFMLNVLNRMGLV